MTQRDRGAPRVNQTVELSSSNRSVTDVAVPGVHPDDPVTSTSMQRLIVTALVTSVLGACPAFADPMSISPETAGVAPEASQPRLRYAAARDPSLGGGFIEFLFGNGPRPPGPPPFFAPPADPYAGRSDGNQSVYARAEPAETADPARPAMEPRFLRQEVAYDGREPAGTVIINTPERYLYLVEGRGRAIRYGIGVGRPGFAWAGTKQISMKREWPEWRPPDEMLRRRPDLPRYMAGGPDNPLGARAMYLGSSLYRIHGSNEPWTIGTQVSSGCIRMRNEDVIDLYGRVKVGTKVIVI
jgi:lipoprotein-anchoring transpeptidase ErfK/SrfK